MTEVQTDVGGTESTTIDLNDDANVFAWAKKLDATTNADQEARAETTKDPR